MVLGSARKLGKNIVDFPDHGVEVISTQDWLSRFWTNPFPHIKSYILGLFPILNWISRYNLGWLSADVVAGVTVGIVLVPQGMSYAQIATLPPEYGLYSSFVGVLVYCIFATSKDVSIGPVAVMSLTVANVIKRVQEQHPEIDGPTIATGLTFICGFILLGVGLLRIGWIVEFIPMPAVSGFMTGTAINVVAGQVPGLMGITGFDTRAPTYQVIINTLKGLPRTALDASWGLTGLVILYIIRYACIWSGKRWPRRARLFFFLSVMRNAFVIIVLTIAAYLYCHTRRDSKGNYPIKILKNVPAGLKHVHTPRIDSSFVSVMAPELPVASIILFLEHIAISKSFGRLNGYKINPNQELIAIGVTNTVGSCFGAYAATGSFSRSALKSKSGVRTPLAGIFTAIVVIVALYGLTGAFFWIPTAGLSAIIIHAVADLVASPNQLYMYWRVSPLEFFIWVAAILVTVFSSIEDGIYTSICASMALLLIHLARPRGQFLGKVSLETDSGDEKETREIFVPIKQNLINNPHIKVMPPPPGILIYRFEESYLYPNCSVFNSVLVDYVKENMRRGKNMNAVKLRDRPWNDNSPRRSSVQEQAINERKPWLHAIILDFSVASHIDTTAIQALIDARNEIERWTDYPVKFHFATILSPWIRRALVAGGFGYGSLHSKVPREVAAVVPYRDGTDHENKLTESASDIERGEDSKTYIAISEKDAEQKRSSWEPVLADATPFFHIDLTSAVRVAERGLNKVRTLKVVGTVQSAD